MNERIMKDYKFYYKITFASLTSASHEKSCSQ